jgi:uncharacterized RDD family membrane protein YckC
MRLRGHWRETWAMIAAMVYAALALYVFFVFVFVWMTSGITMVSWTIDRVVA